jgi:arginine-tRNA-protein transferase
MFEYAQYPKTMHPDKLDELLSMGWFRMGQSIFTTNFILVGSSMYRTIWLRHVIKQYQETKTLRNLKKRNRDFRIELKPLEITPAHEELFEKYKSSIPFEAASSLHQLLDGYVYEPTSIYTTYEINLYDRFNLIGCSYFDIGRKSAEGISSYFDPAYRSYSIGKYLIYMQLEVCKENGFHYFYPGYFIPGHSHLDYKLDIGTHCLEFFNPEDALWYPISDYVDQGIPIEYQDFFMD